MKWALAAIAAILAFTGAAPIDSQQVLQHYAARLLKTEEPKVLIFTYTVSQAGPHNLEQTHHIYRSGDLVRDETVLVDGQRSKNIRISRYRNRYTLENLAPRMTQYAFVFRRSLESKNDVSYIYQAIPLATPAGFVVDSMTIDGRGYLPSQIRFHTATAAMKGQGVITFGRSGHYWVPVTVNVEARINGKPARERIAFSSYQFPESLPKSTFLGPKPLPTATLPSF